MNIVVCDKRSYVAAVKAIYVFNDLSNKYKTLSINKNSIKIKLKNFMRSNYDVTNY